MAQVTRSVTRNSRSKANSRWRKLQRRVRMWRRDGSDRAVTQRMAGSAFLLRVVNAGIAFISQILLARWMGDHEYGIYAYVWVWLLVLGGIAGLGLPSAAPKFIPEYTERGALNQLRGFLRGGRLFAVAVATLIALLGCIVLLVAGDAISASERLPLYLGLMCLPMFVLTDIQDGIARSYNWVKVALAPAYLVRPLLILLFVAMLHVAQFPATALWVLGACFIAVCVTALAQMRMLDRRLAEHVPAGPLTMDVRQWISVALPIFLVDGFYLLLTYADVLILNEYVPPDDVAIYYAATKIMAIVAFVYFAVSAAATHRFTEYAATGDRERLHAFVHDTVRWTFWPSLVAAVGLMIIGKPLLWLFGPSFTAGYPLLAVLAVGLLARAAVGPVERILSMLGQQRVTASVYAGCFILNVVLNLVLIPYLGLMGAAVATAVALSVESILLYAAAKRRLGLNVNVFSLKTPAIGASFPPVPEGVELRVLTVAQAEGIRREWRDLAARAADANVYYEPAFALAALRHLPDGKGTEILTVWENARLIGLVPVRKTLWRWGIPVPLMKSWQAYAPLCTPLLDAERGATAALAVLDDLRHRAGLWFIPFMNDAGPSADLWRVALTACQMRHEVFRAHKRAALTGGTLGASDFEGGISAKKRKEWARQARRMAEGSEVSFVVASAPDDVHAALEEFLALEAAGWKGNSGALARSAPHAGFIREAMGELAHEGKARVAVLRRGGVPVSAGLLLKSGSRAWYFKTAYDEKRARFSPGVQLTLDISEHLLADEAIAMTDSTAVANHPMIDSIWRERIEIADWLVGLRPGVGFMVACLLERMRSSLRTLAHKLVRRMGK